MRRSTLQLNSGLTLRGKKLPSNRSRFVIALLSAFLLGIFIGDLLKFDLFYLIGIVIGLIFFLILFWKESFWQFIIFALIGLILGLGYFRFWDDRQNLVLVPIGKEIEFSGQIINHPDISKEKSRFVVRWQKKKILINTNRYPEYKYGNILKIGGTLKKPNDYYFHQGILGVLYNPEIRKINVGGNFFIKNIYNLRDRFEEVLNKTLSEPASSFAAGLILGSKRNIPDSLMSDFNRTGTTHIIAVSGYNVTIIIAYVGIFLGIFSRKLRFWGSLLFIISFVIMTGAPASVLRAGILAGLIAFGHFQGRRVNMTILLLLVASIMILFNPYNLKYDISFQLSFLAFVGLIYLSPIISSLKMIKWMPTLFKSTFSETMGAQTMVFPILIFYFGRISIVSPIVNVLILWIIPISMFFIFIIALLGWFWISLGQIIGWLGWIFLEYILIVVRFFSKIPWASIEIKTDTWWWMLLVYVGILLICYNKKKKHEP